MTKKAPQIDYKATGRRIKYLRYEKHITVAKMQDYLWLASPRSIYKWQRGDVMPSIENLVGLSALFEVPMDDIIVIEDTK